CEGGWLQLEGSARVCGRNQRFDRPVVLFSDKPIATLNMHVTVRVTVGVHVVSLRAKDEDGRENGRWNSNGITKQEHVLG
ncbi:hypothetical protein X777_00538, partial [Ooceraea biroi]